jgi:hypothetical protein
MPIGATTTPATLMSAPTRTLTAIEQTIVSTSSKYGLDTETALRIAKCESGLRQYEADGKVVRGVVNPQDVGVFQINEAYHLKQAEEMGYDIYTPEGNIGYALWLMKNGGNRHWNSSRSCWHTSEQTSAVAKKADFNTELLSFAKPLN